jgi:hypothetical protein
MDVVFGFLGDGFAVIVTDTTSVQQIIIQKDDMEKTLDLDSHKLMALSGPKGDCTYFGEYIQANMKLYELKNGAKLSTHAAANFTRNNLAESLRKGPYQVNILLAGYDADEGVCSLYFLDYMASMQKVNSGGGVFGGRSHSHKSPFPPFFFPLHIIFFFPPKSVRLREHLFLSPSERERLCEREKYRWRQMFKRTPQTNPLTTWVSFERNVVPDATA